MDWSELGFIDTTYNCKLFQRKGMHVFSVSTLCLSCSVNFFFLKYSVNYCELTFVLSDVPFLVGDSTCRNP